MNRRGFLGLLASTPVAAALAPDLVELLTPKRSIFLPPRGGWFAPSIVQRYTHQTYALGFAITDEEGAYAGRLVSSGAFRATLAKSLNEIFSEQYAKRSKEWEEIFR